MAKKKKYYVVWQGVTPGVYDSWAACQLQIKGYPDARYKSFKTREEAEAAFHGNISEHIDTRVRHKDQPIGNRKPINKEGVVWESISVDAACSGNPGVMEYQGVDTRTGFPYFHQKFQLGTNNIGEFLAIVHALAMCQKEGKDLPIYTDSRNAMLWVKKRKCKTTLDRNERTRKLFEVIERAENWLKNNTWTNKILKWETEKWGEIPADFGRK